MRQVVVAELVADGEPDLRMVLPVVRPLVVSGVVAQQEPPPDVAEPTVERVLKVVALRMDGRPLFVDQRKRINRRSGEAVCLDDVLALLAGMLLGRSFEFPGAA